MTGGRCELILSFEHDIDHIYFPCVGNGGYKVASLMDALVLPVKGYLIPSILADSVSNIFRSAHKRGALLLPTGVLFDCQSLLVNDMDNSPSLFLKLGTDKAAMATPGEALGTNQSYRTSPGYLDELFHALTELGRGSEGLVTPETVASQHFSHMDVIDVGMS